MYRCGHPAQLVPAFAYSLDTANLPWLSRAKKNQRGLGMNKLILAGAFSLVATSAPAQYTGNYGTGSNPSTHGVQGHTTSSGTYVQPHVATNSNSTQRDNFSATGNVNPHTGSVGARNPRY